MSTSFRFKRTLFGKHITKHFDLLCICIFYILDLVIIINADQFYMLIAADIINHFTVIVLQIVKF